MNTSTAFLILSMQYCHLLVRVPAPPDCRTLKSLLAKAGSCI